MMLPANSSQVTAGLGPGGHAWLVLGAAANRHPTLQPWPQPERVPLEDVTAGKPLNTVVVPTKRTIQSPKTTPLFYLAPVDDGWRPYVQALVTPTELMFLAMGTDVIPGDVAMGPSWFDWLTRRYTDYAPQVTNHQQVFTTYRPDDEIEHKFTIPSDTDIWLLAADMLRTITAGQLPGWIAEYRNEFEQWDFMNHLFEIADPPEERGYISFIPAVDGRWIIKRKWFTKDQPIRKEQRDRNIVLPVDANLEEEIGNRFGVTPTWGASFRRVRFDVNMESLHTGHGYSVMFDRSTTTADPPAVLQQCEIEYLRSRTLLPVSGSELADEFTDLCDWVRSWLQEREIKTVENHLSKLTFLRAATHKTDDHQDGTGGELPTC